MISPLTDLLIGRSEITVISALPTKGEMVDVPTQASKSFIICLHEVT